MKKTYITIFIFSLFLFACSSSDNTEHTSTQAKEDLEETIDQENNELDKVQQMIENDKRKLDSMKKAMDKIIEAED